MVPSERAREKIASSPKRAEAAISPEILPKTGIGPGRSQLVPGPWRDPESQGEEPLHRSGRAGRDRGREGSPGRARVCVGTLERSSARLISAAARIPSDRDNDRRRVTNVAAPRLPPETPLTPTVARGNQHAVLDRPKTVTVQKAARKPRLPSIPRRIRAARPEVEVPARAIASSTGSSLGEPPRSPVPRVLTA